MKPPMARFAFFTLVFAVIVSGCGNSGDRSASTPVENIQASSTIGISGGTVLVADPNSPIHGTRVDIPPGAVSEDTTISIALPSAAAGRPLPGSLLSAGLQISFQPKDLQFSRPVSITIPYNDDNDDGLVDGTASPETGVYALAFDEEAGLWLYALKMSQDPSDKTMELLTDSFAIYAPAVDGANTVATSKVSIFTIDGLSFSKIFPGYSDRAHEEFRPSYLKKALRHQFDVGLEDRDVHSYGCDPDLEGCDPDASWSGDPDLTPQLIHGSDTIKTSLKKILRSEYNRAKSANKHFMMVAHSWGTVLGYLALQYCQNEFDPRYDVVPDLVITLSSPMGTSYRSLNLPDPFFPPLLAPVVAVMMAVVDEYTAAMIDLAHAYSDAYRSAPKFKSWINYHSSGDIISGPVGNLIEEAEDRSFHQANSLTTYSTTTQDHGISSLDEDTWNEYLDSDQINTIAEPFRNEIEDILKVYTSS